MREVTIAITEKAYSAAERRAWRSGFVSTEHFLSTLLLDGIEHSSQDYNQIFTSEVIAHLDRISADINGGGRTYSIDEVREQLPDKQKTWLANHYD